MIRLESIIGRANALANKFDGDPEVKALAKVVEELCRECEKLNKHVQVLERAASAAEFAARGTKGLRR